MRDGTILEGVWLGRQRAASPCTCVYRAVWGGHPLVGVYLVACLPAPLCTEFTLMDSFYLPLEKMRIEESKGTNFDQGLPSNSFAVNF